MSKARVLFDFLAQTTDELSISTGEEITITDQTVGNGWWNAVNYLNKSGLVPSSYVELLDYPEPDYPPPPLRKPNTRESVTDGTTHLYEDWETDDSDAASQPGARKLSDNSHLHQSSENNVQKQHASDYAKFAPIRKGFSRAFIRTGAEDLLLGCEPSVSPTTEAVIEFVDSQYRWQSTGDDFQCSIQSFHKDSKLKGFKSFIAYQITSKLVSSHVNRRYKHFDWLRDRLVEKYPCVCIPPLPDKVITGRYEDDFVDVRRALLQMWLDRICRHPVISKSRVLHHFLSCTDDKQWKQGKREAETDVFQGARFYYTVKCDQLDPNYSATGIDKLEVYENFVNALDKSLPQMIESFSELHRRFASSTREDFANLSNGCFALVQALKLDPHFKASQTDLSTALSNFGDSLKCMSISHGIPIDSTHLFLAGLREYSRLVANLSPVIGLLKSATITCDEAKRLLDEEKISSSDYQQIQHHCRHIFCSVQAECYLVTEQLSQDFLSLLVNYVRDRAKFYRQQAEQCDNVATSLTK